MKNNAFSICLSFIIMLGFLQALAGIGYTATVTLEWDPSESDITGYKLYYGTATGDYNQVTDVGNVTTYQVSGLEDGVIYFAVTAYDTEETESNYSNEIRVRFVDGLWVNEPPIADAGPDQTVDVGVTVTLDGSNSTDPDGDIQVYLWEQTGGVQVTLSDPKAVRPDFSAPDVGPDGESLTFQLTVTDQSGLQSTDTCVVNITWDNDPPTANAGPDQTVDEGVTVTVDASNSTDPDGDIQVYLWEQTGGVQVTLSDPKAVRPDFSAPDVGPDGESLTFQLTVTDQSGLQSTDTCVVNITWDNDPPTANAGPDQTVDEGATVTVDASNSTDPDGDIQVYLWEQTGGVQVTLSDPKAVRPDFSAPDVGPDGESLTFQLTVTDQSGLQSTDTCVVNITWDNDPPTANAGPDQTVDEGVTVTVDASNSTDPDGDIQVYLWEQTGGVQVTLSDPKAVRPDFSAPDVGPDGESLTFQLTVTDQSGLQSTDTCVVNITWDNDPPTANAGPDQTVDEGATVTLDGSNSTDPDDGIQRYWWTQTAGTGVTLSDPSSAQPTFTTPKFHPKKSAFTFQITATDEGGLQSTDSMVVNVIRGTVNEPPTADAGPDQTVLEQTVVTLDGYNSTDPDDELADYLWTQTLGLPVILSDTTAVQPTFTAPEVGSEGAALTFRVTVTDVGGLQGTDESTVTVTDLDSGEITVVSIEPNTLPAGGTIDVIISGSAFVDGAVVSFENGLGPAPTATNTVVFDEQTILSTVSVRSGGPQKNRVWGVMITNPDGASGVLVDGLTVAP